MESKRRKFGMILAFAVLFTTLVFVSVGCASKTPPEEAWNRTFGGIHGGCGYSVQQTTDGGYIVTGNTYSFGAVVDDVYLVKTDENGTEEWNTTFGGLDSEWGRSVQQTTDGGYIITGRTRSFATGGINDYDVYLIKTDKNGTLEWSKTFGGTKWDFGNSVQQTTDGGYIIAGLTKLAGSDDVYLIKTDEKGTRMWSKTLGGLKSEQGFSVQQTIDGGYIVTGYTISFGAGLTDVYLVKTDENGIIEWNKAFGGTDWDYGYSIQQTTDGGYIVTGDTYSFGAGSDDVYLVKTDENGIMEWNKTFGGLDSDWGRSVQQTTDGGIS
jgi:hypothetical protein